MSFYRGICRPCIANRSFVIFVLCGFWQRSCPTHLSRFMDGDYPNWQFPHEMFSTLNAKSSLWQTNGISKKRRWFPDFIVDMVQKKNKKAINTHNKCSLMKQSSIKQLKMYTNWRNNRMEFIQKFYSTFPPIHSATKSSYYRRRISNKSAH